MSLRARLGSTVRGASVSLGARLGSAVRGASVSRHAPLRSPAIALAGAVLAAIALSACETTQEKSAQLERAAHRSDRTAPNTKVVSVSKPDRAVQVLTHTVLTSREGTAVAVTLRNLSARPIADAPIEIEVEGARGVLYSNATPGLAASLITAPLLEPHGAATWVDDQVQLAGRVASVKVLVGTGRPPPAHPPKLQLTEVRRTEGGQAVTGTVANASAVEQRELVVYALARRAGKVVAAGRGIVSELKARSSARFEIYLIGDASGATLSLSAPPTTF